MSKRKYSVNRTDQINKSLLCSLQCDLMLILCHSYSFYYKTLKVLLHGHTAFFFCMRWGKRVCYNDNVPTATGVIINVPMHFS